MVPWLRCIVEGRLCSKKEGGWPVRWNLCRKYDVAGCDNISAARLVLNLVLSDLVVFCRQKVRISRVLPFYLLAMQHLWKMMQCGILKKKVLRLKCLMVGFAFVLQRSTARRNDILNHNQ